MLVTHEHLDHNGVGAIGGDPVTLRATAGRLDSPVGEVLAVAAEHDEAAGIERGANTLFTFTLGGRRVAHLGDLGQRELRDEQAQALGFASALSLPWLIDEAQDKLAAAVDGDPQTPIEQPR